MSIEQQVRTALTERADAVDPAPLSGPMLRVRAGSRRRKVTRTSLAAVATLAVLLVVPTVVTERSLPPAASTVDTWPARGDLAGDTMLAAAARRGWEAAPVLPGELPHRDVRVLLAAKTSFGRYVVLTGFNALGHRRLAVLSDDPRDHAPYARRLRLRSDQPFPDDDLLTYRTSRRVGTIAQSLLLVIGPPDVTSMRWRDQFDSWATLPSTGGVAAWVVRTDYPDLRVRAYRGAKRVAQARTAGPGRNRMYLVDEALVPRSGKQQSQCQRGACEVSVGTGRVSAIPDQPGDVFGVHRTQDASWDDMSDQAEQLWLNWALSGRPATSWSSRGADLSALLPDNSGVHLSLRSVNDLPQHLVLYVDRPDWPIGQLYLAEPADPKQPVRAVTALIPADNGVRLVAFAGSDVEVRYRIGTRGAWHPVPVSDGIGSTKLTGSVGADAVDIAVTYQGQTTTGKVDAFTQLLS